LGRVQICGFLELECGDLRASGMDFRGIWSTSKVFEQVRRVDDYGGRCGVCEFRRICGGCRARAYAMTGDYLAEEPLCSYRPRTLASEQATRHG
jgi:AdoMet-dependent heme synthase